MQEEGARNFRYTTFSSFVLSNLLVLVSENCLTFLLSHFPRHHHLISSQLSSRVSVCVESKDDDGNFPKRQLCAHSSTVSITQDFYSIDRNIFKKNLENCQRRS
jgi:hypothetical protein